MPRKSRNLSIRAQGTTEIPFLVPSGWSSPTLPPRPHWSIANTPPLGFSSTMIILLPRNGVIILLPIRRDFLGKDALRFMHKPTWKKVWDLNILCSFRCECEFPFHLKYFLSVYLVHTSLIITLMMMKATSNWEPMQQAMCSIFYKHLFWSAQLGRDCLDPCFFSGHSWRSTPGS